MQRALELAQLGLGAVSPNPMVGCVIVHKDKIIGEGWHQKFGGPHAEVNAINDVKDQPLLPESTVYVSLEPCSHFGKTPPCADLLIKHQVKKVVIGQLDVNPLVKGKGLQKLDEAGIQVEYGVLENEGKILNKRFFIAMEKRRPYIILKWAETADGFIARKNFDSKWISSDHSRKLVHKWRSEEDAVLVGTNTAHYDNPKLNVRDWSGKDPVRVVIDKSLRLTLDLHLFDKSIATICYNLEKDSEEKNLTLVKLKEENFLPTLISDLFKRNIYSLFVEGGTAIINELIKNRVWDEARVFKSDQIFGEGIDAPEIKGRLDFSKKIGNDELCIYQPLE